VIKQGFEMSREDRDVNIYECNSIALAHIIQNANASYRAGDITAEERDSQIRNQAAAEIAIQNEVNAPTFIQDVCDEYAAYGIDLMAIDVSEEHWDASLAQVIKESGLDQELIEEVWEQMAEEELHARAEREKEWHDRATFEINPKLADSTSGRKQDADSRFGRTKKHNAVQEERVAHHKALKAEAKKQPAGKAPRSKQANNKQRLLNRQNARQFRGMSTSEVIDGSLDLGYSACRK
jgi:hypothetical protein